MLLSINHTLFNPHKIRAATVLLRGLIQCRRWGGGSFPTKTPSFPSPLPHPKMKGKEREKEKEREREGEGEGVDVLVLQYYT